MSSDFRDTFLDKLKFWNNTVCHPSWHEDMRPRGRNVNTHQSALLEDSKQSRTNPGSDLKSTLFINARPKDLQYTYIICVCVYMMRSIFELFFYSLSSSSIQQIARQKVFTSSGIMSHLSCYPLSRHAPLFHLHSSALLFYRWLQKAGCKSLALGKVTGSAWCNSLMAFCKQKWLDERLGGQEWWCRIKGGYLHHLTWCKGGSLRTKAVWMVESHWGLKISRQWYL